MVRNTNTAPPGRSRRLGAIRKSADDLRARVRLLKESALTKLGLSDSHFRDFTGTYVFKRKRSGLFGWTLRVKARPKRKLNARSLSNLRPRKPKPTKSDRS